MEIPIHSIEFSEVTLRDKNNNVFTYNIQDDLKIDEHNINQVLMEQSSKYAWWANLHEIVKRYREAEERKLEHLASQLNLQVRESFKQQKVKPTKDMVDACITTNQSYQQQLESVEDWKYREGQLQAVVRAFNQRKDMLIQISAELRQTNKDKEITNPYSY